MYYFPVPELAGTKGGVEPSTVGTPLLCLCDKIRMCRIIEYALARYECAAISQFSIFGCCRCRCCVNTSLSSFSLFFVVVVVMQMDLLQFASHVGLAGSWHYSYSVYDYISFFAMFVDDEDVIWPCAMLRAMIPELIYLFSNWISCSAADHLNPMQWLSQRQPYAQTQARGADAQTSCFMVGLYAIVFQWKIDAIASVTKRSNGSRKWIAWKVIVVAHLKQKLNWHEKLFFFSIL